MGGCHCSYRNCSMRSDGVTHMFHFPVFDKVRCHQWLVNTGRLEFLNLKVSQLKNRVICQHHFKDDDFMNYKKEKLKFNAVPRINGPFCEPQTLDENDAQEEVSAYDISLEDIENEILSLNEKKANFSVKYADFLINGYPMSDPLLLLKPKKENEIIDFVPELFFDPEPPKDEKNVRIDVSSNPEPELCKQTKSHISVPIESKSQVDKSQNHKYDKDIVIPTNQSDTKQSLQNKKNICIVSEKTISDLSCFGTEPIILGKLEPVQPSLILQFPNQRKLAKTNDSISTNIVNKQDINQSDAVESKYDIVNDTELKYEVPFNTTEQPTSTGQLSECINKMEIHSTPVKNQSKAITLQKNKNTNMKSINCGDSLLIKESPNFASTIKTKVTPERVAVIEKKRKFNMKLRDIVESCLDKIDMPDNVSTMKVPNANSFDNIETRLKKMEKNLLRKIEQNAHQIIHLKNAVLPESKKRTTYTQTTTNEETHKKYLYQEISKYLSPDANNLLYEELFINKYAQKIPKASTTPKRRRCR